MSTLQLKDVKYIYRNKHQTVYALDGISYTFEPGKLYAVVGKSGSGKTSLLSVMAGLDLPSVGEVVFNGANISGINRDKYRLNHVSVIYQSLNLLPFLTSLENVAFPLTFRGMPEREARKIAAEKIKSVGLDENFFTRLPSMLSGGEQQRVAIARALALKTKFILADEPTGNLDSENGEKIVGLLKDLVYKENLCVVIVTHDQSISRQADVILKISDGRLCS